jgi:16S rRNA (guanine527-N7)-methyltransferase
VNVSAAGPVEPAPGPATLFEVLSEAQGLGFVGGATNLSDHVVQAEVLADVVEGLPGGRDAFPESVLDLGSGGGLPGLVVAQRWPTARVTLLDGGERRAAFLSAAVARLDLAPRVSVACGRAEVLGREPALRQAFNLVVVRAFGPPAVVAECGRPFLVSDGRLVVSEPPASDGSRWNHPDALAQLGLAQESLVVRSDHRFQVLRATGPCPDRYPRRTGVPTKRPLF